ncbi:transcriptional regulator with XRE-family HTH domain [Paenibacillus sp. DS2015]|uniref:helix-turn-helix domain-containing protein n=1 Tax=Paenibacillus sp. DS2015 TaxID=3373917 RepID=UPI003D1BF9CB
MSITGDRIRKLRESKKLTQLDLADKVDMNNSVLSRIEAGKRPVEDIELIKFADFFDVDGDYLLGRTDKLRFIEANMSFLGGPDKYTEDEIEEMEAALFRYRKTKERLKKQMEDNEK